MNYILLINNNNNNKTVIGTFNFVVNMLHVLKLISSGKNK